MNAPVVGSLNIHNLLGLTHTNASKCGDARNSHPRRRRRRRRHRGLPISQRPYQNLSSESEKLNNNNGNTFAT